MGVRRCCEGWRAADRALWGRGGADVGLRNEEKVFWLGGFVSGGKRVARKRSVAGLGYFCLGVQLISGCDVLQIGEDLDCKIYCEDKGL